MTSPTHQPPRSPVRSRLAWAIVGTLAALAVVAGVTAAATANDHGGRAASAPATRSVVEPALEEDPTSEGGPTPEPSPAGTKEARALKLGQKHRLSTAEVTLDVAVLKVKHGDDYEGVQVRTCNRGAPISVSRIPWSLGYSNFEELHDIDTIGGGLPAPAYEDRDLDAGQCAKGWINFTSVPGKRPNGIQYAPATGEPLRWSF